MRALAMALVLALSSFAGVAQLPAARLASPPGTAGTTGTPGAAQQALMQDLEKIRHDTGVPALGVAVVDETGAVWAFGLGHPKRGQALKSSEHTLFRIGSISKTFAALAVMKLVEQGRLDLQAPLKTLAPEIVFDNPWEATHPLRLVHLLEHSSGWEDFHSSEAAFAAPDDMSLKAALAFRPATRTSRWMPGTRSSYSNVGTLAVAYVVEKVSGRRYEDYVKEAVLQPLGMQDSGFFKNEAYVQRGAELYALGAPDQALPYWQMLDRPAGAMHASAADMGRLLQMLLQRGELSGQALLSPASIERMQTPATTLAAAQGLRVGQGLGHESSGFAGSARLFQGHDGAVMGGISRLVYEPTVGRGYVLMQSNDDFSAFFRLSRRLHEHLLSGLTPPSQAPVQALPASMRDLEGWYRHITPRRELTRFTEDVMDLSQFEVLDDGLRQTFLLGGEQRFQARGGALLVDQSTGLPMLARVQDPLVGDAIQIGANTYQRISAGWVYGLIVMGLAWAVLLPIQAACMVRDAWRARRGLGAPWRLSRALLVIGATCLLAALMAGLVFGHGDADFGRITATSLTVFAGSLLFALFTLAAGARLFWELRRERQTSKPRSGGLLIFWTLLQGGVLVYLLAYGMVGVRTWV
ncbi:serine hydrolase domain-containing protein [Roseateles sp.]|uniref:serine hydrolase domain-containing protein n=1 Tax=Roseateles sp. TaxID=1971397 RepID=UPI003BA406C3